ncbi:hypothetical protein ACLKA7_000818 [Drosophila subpalustris]
MKQKIVRSVDSQSQKHSALLPEHTLPGHDDGAPLVAAEAALVLSIWLPAIFPPRGIHPAVSPGRGLRMEWAISSAARSSPGGNRRCFLLAAPADLALAQSWTCDSGNAAPDNSADLASPGLWRCGHESRISRALCHLRAHGNPVLHLTTALIWVHRQTGFPIAES